MLLRVFLILAILAGIGTVAVTQFMVKPHVQSIIAERETNKENWQRELARANKLNKDLKETQTRLADTEKTLEETKTQLAATTQRADEQQKRADGLQAELTTTKQQLSTAQQDLAAWRVLGIPVETVAQVIESEKRFRSANAVLEEEKKIILAENKRIQGILDSIQRPDDIVPMPGVKGTILAVDPKWNFVVLDVGEKAGAKQRGIFMVSRNGKLIGKVKVATVQPDRSIANIMPGWQLEEIMEGDQVIF
jgi:Tfp pilus assembly protein FimV